MTDTHDTSAGTIQADVAARLIMVEQSEFLGLARSNWFNAVAKGRYSLVEVVQGYLKSLRHEIERGRTAPEVAVHLDISTRGFLELVERGIIPRAAKASYNLDECRKLYIRHMRGVASGHGDRNAGASLSAERALLAKEQRDGVSMKNAISRGEFAPVAMMEKALTDLFGVFRERVLTIPGKISTALSNRSRDEIEVILREELHETLDELSDPATLLGNHSRDRAGMPRSEGPAEAQPH